MSQHKVIKCLLVDDEPLARSILVDHIYKIDFLEVVGECKNALEATTFLNNNQVDVLFLDINMPHISGVEFAKQLNPKPALVFTTAYSEFALEGFELEAVDYLMKPIRFERFFKAANKLLKLIGREEKKILVESKTASEETPSFIYLKAEDKMIRIELDEIIAIESQGHYVRIFTPNKNYIIHQSISEMETKLPSANFFRTHRSFVIGKKHIKAYSPAFIETEKVKVPIGRSYKAEVMEKL